MTAPAQAALALAQELALPGPVQSELQRLCPLLPWPRLGPALTGLCDPQNAEAACQALAQALAPLEAGDGLAQLAVHLAAAANTRQLYRAAGVPDAVFLATMGCFGRFLRETYARQGRWVFDRAFWTWRQLACRLFRLGQLEFEYGSPPPGVLSPGLAPGDPVLSVHIPSDACLTRENLEQSYQATECFFAQAGAVFCHMGRPKAVLCGSWLLSPALAGLLPKDSGIRRFAADYRLYAVEENDDSFYQWLFGKKAPPPQLPGQTSLQRAVRRHLAQGKTVGMARGVLDRSALEK